MRHHHEGGDDRVLRQLEKLVGKVNRLHLKLNHLHKDMLAMAANLDRLESEVTEIGDVVDSAVTTLQGLAQEIRDLKDASTNTVDPAAIDALADRLDAKAQALATAIAANTPAENPTPEPAPEEPAPDAA